MARKKLTDTPSFSELKKLSAAGSAKLSVYLSVEELEILDHVRNGMGGVIPPGHSDVIRYVVREYWRLKQAGLASPKKNQKKT